MLLGKEGVIASYHLLPQLLKNYDERNCPCCCISLYCVCGVNHQLIDCESVFVDDLGIAIGSVVVEEGTGTENFDVPGARVDHFQHLRQHHRHPSYGRTGDDAAHARSASGA